MQEATLTFAEIISGARIIPLSKGKITFVDEEDFEFLSQWGWHFNGGKYAARNAKRHESLKSRMIFMHRVVAKTPDGMKTDHQNLNKLDNRRFNLRTATNSQNGANVYRHKGNTSGFKGVHFKTAEEAHEAYKRAAASIFGNYANSGVPAN